MGRGILLWLLGIPIPIIILLMLFWREQNMSQPDTQRGETDAPDGAEKREHGVVNAAARVRRILGPAIAARL
jgi:hypothetical protein